MKQGDWQHGSPETAGERGTQPAQRAAPGKVTRTSKLSGPRARALQQERLAPGAPLHGLPSDDERGQQTGGGPVEDWTLVALRPDLHQTPILRKSSEVGLVDVSPPDTSRSSAPGAAPVQAQQAEEDFEPITVTGHPVHFEPQGRGLRVHVAWYVLERQAGREPQRLAEGQQPPRVEGPRLRVTTLVQRLEEHTGMRMQPGPRRELLARQLMPLTDREPYVYTALLSEDELSHWFGQRAWQGYLEAGAPGGGAEAGVTEGGAEPAPRVTIEEVLRLVEEDDWDADTLAAQLDDAQMRALSVEQRVRLLDHVSDGYRVDDEDEQTLIRLLATTPAAQAAGVRSQLGAERLQQLDDAIDFAEYRDYHLALRVLFFQSLSPEQAAEQMASAREFPWADPGFIHALWNKRFYYQEVELHDDGKLHVRYWTTWGGGGMPSEAVALDPFEMIAVRFHYPEEYAGAERDQIIYMPAINLRSLYRKQFRQELQTVVDVGLLALGGAGLISAGTRLARAVAALDLALGAADLVIRDFRHEIARSQEGRDFLAAWEIASTLVAIYGVGRAAMEAPQVFQRLRQAWQRLRGTGRTGNLGNLDSQVDEVLHGADEVEDAARQSTHGADAAAEPGAHGGDVAAEHGADVGASRGTRDREPESHGSDGRRTEGHETEEAPVGATAGASGWNNSRAEELLGTSEGRLGLPNNRGRQYPGHAGDHLPPEGASRTEAMAHAQRRPDKQNTTVYFNRRHAVQDLRDALNAHAEEIANLRPGQSLSFSHGTPVRPGFDSVRGGPPTEVSWREVTVALERLSSGELHLVHFSPRIAR